MVKRIWFLWIAAVVVIAGCSIDDSSDNSENAQAVSTNLVQSAETNTTTAADEPAPSTQTDVTGIWVLSASGNVIDAWTMSQSGVSVQGANQDGRRIVGSVSGDQLIADLLPSSTEATFSINATVSGNSMSGTATSTTGTNSFTAERVVDEG